MNTRLKAVVPAAAKSSATVCVACKIPNGLRLQLQTETPRIVDTPTGPKEVKFWVKGGKTYNVHGPAYPVAPPAGYPRQPMIEGGYAITRGIPADFWNAWWEQNKEADYCRAPDGSDQGFIFAYPDLDDAVAAAVEHEALLTGMEPLSAEMDKNGRLKDPRIPRPLSAGIEHLRPDDNQAA
jgi:hypothetical protein